MQSTRAQLLSTMVLCSDCAAAVEHRIQRQLLACEQVCSNLRANPAAANQLGMLQLNLSTPSLGIAASVIRAAPLGLPPAAAR